MTPVCSVFSQLLQLFPRGEFARAVKQHAAERKGCGSPCLMMAMVDAVTGEVYSLPLAMKDTMTLPWLCIGESVGRNPEVTFRQDSRLMVIEATPDYFRDNHHSYTHYYLWQGNRWQLLYRERLD